MKIIWISAFFHDSAAALIEDWKIISAVQEERFTRKKQDESFPVKSIEWILEENNLSLDDIDFFVFYEKPFLKFERLLENYLSEVPFWIASFFTAIPVWIKEKLFLKKILAQNFYKISDSKLKEKEFTKEIYKKIKFSTHHWSHAWSAFYPSPFEDAAILTIDWVWEWTTTSIAHWNSNKKWNKIEFLQDIKYPHSLWLFYSAITYFLWFKVNSWEYKVMWLAPYWENSGENSWIKKYYKLMKENLIDIKDDWSFRLNLKYFSYLRWLKMTNKKMEKVFWIKRRIPEKDLEQVHMDIAWALQMLTEEIMIKLAKTAKKITWSKNLCLAWWVALNCVWNWKILEESIFENIWIQPASWDAWWAVWCALDFYYSENKRIIEKNDWMNWSYLWPKSSEEEILEMAENFWAKFEKFSDEEISDKISEELKNWKVIWWHQWKMEYWPRSLWARSIIWDSQNPEMQEKMNLKIKFRESFRPFAPAVLEEDVEKYFKISTKSPYMLLVADVQENIRKNISEDEKKLFWIEKLNVPKSEIPAVTHVDYSARVQTVSKETNPKFHNLITRFKEKTWWKNWCSVLINTSFNVRWEPIVCTAEDSYKCFMRTWMDFLVIENFVFKKEDQPDFDDSEKWEEEFVLD
jgi:carbamoyltransferase